MHAALSKFFMMAFRSVLFAFTLVLGACVTSPTRYREAVSAAAFADSRQGYTPPPDSASALAGVDWTGSPVGASFSARFAECDAHDTCGGSPVKYSCSADPNRNTALLRLKQSVLFFDAKLALDADGSPYAAAHAGSINQVETSLRYPLPGSPSVNADRVPFVVIPLGSFDKDLGVQLGDVAAVVYGNTRVFAIVGDEGPKCKLGEGSIALHEALGHAVCKERAGNGDCTKLADASIGKNVLFFVFPNTRARIYPGISPENINQRIQDIGQKAWREFIAP